MVAAPVGSRLKNTVDSVEIFIGQVEDDVKQAIVDSIAQRENITLTFIFFHNSAHRIQMECTSSRKKLIDLRTSSGVSRIPTIPEITVTRNLRRALSTLRLEIEPYLNSKPNQYSTASLSVVFQAGQIKQVDRQNRSTYETAADAKSQRD